LATILVSFLLLDKLYSFRVNSPHADETGTHITKSKVAISLPSAGYGCPTTGKRMTSRLLSILTLAGEVSACGGTRNKIIGLLCANLIIDRPIDFPIYLFILKISKPLRSPQL
jgi:hypothetical protein